MWDNQYEPPETMFDSLEPAISVILVIATLAIIPFTPLSPFQGREPSALDQFVGINVSGTAAKMAPVRSASGSADRVLQQAETPVEASTIAR